MKKIILKLWLLIIAAGLFSACEEENTEKTTGKYKPVTKIKNGYEYKALTEGPLNARIYTLDNGLKVYLSVNKKQPRIYTNIAIKAGSKFDPPQSTGLAHYLEHIMFKGTSEIGSLHWGMEKIYLEKIERLFEKHKKTEDSAKRAELYAKIDKLSNIAAQYCIPNEYDKIASLIGASQTNAYTSLEQTIYVNDIPANELERWIRLEAERMSEMVPRLFHTELETVYEEKNRALDNDNRKIWNTLLEGLFPGHPYGTQTTLGKVKHLKNPSITDIKNYFNKYYVPNNMAICLSGDFDPDKAIKLIDKHFGDFKKQEVPRFNKSESKNIEQSIEKEIYGPDAESVTIGFKFSGQKAPSSLKMEMVSRILANSQAGLIDLNLNQNQEILGGYSYPLRFNDGSALVLQGQAKRGQTLEQVKSKLLSQIDSLKQGKFDKWLLEAIVNDMKRTRMKNLENNKKRVQEFVNAFTGNYNWENYISEIEKFEALKKDGIVDFAKQHFNNNYVTIYKRTGNDTSRKKIEKPDITPVNVNRDKKSGFFKKLSGIETPTIKPEFVDYEKDLTKTTFNSQIPLLYKKNDNNKLFNLYYKFDMGKNHNKKLPYAIKYLQYLGNEKYAANALSREFYKLGCDFNVSTGKDEVYVEINGLDKNFEKALDLFESLLNNPQPNKKALDEMIKGVLKQRKNNKLSKETILRHAMVNYAKYGPESPFTHILNKKALQSLTPRELINIIKDLTHYQHKIMYYGPKDEPELKTILKNKHKVPASLKPVPEEKTFEELDTEKNRVYWADYDMKQAEMIFLTKSVQFDKDIIPEARMYNNYFGSGMGSIVFQELRESRGLAYSVYAHYSIADEKGKPNYQIAYIGTQADKLPEAKNGMLTLMQNLPESPNNFANAKDAIIKNIQTNRILGKDVLFHYEKARKKGLNYDIRKDIYREVQNMTLHDITKFHQQYLKDKQYKLLVIGKKENLNFDALHKFGNVKKLELEEIFGY